MAKRPTEQMVQLLRDSASNNYVKQAEASRVLADAFAEIYFPLNETQAGEAVAEEVVRKGTMSGDIHSMIFSKKILEPGQVPEFPVHFLAPGTEKDHVAYIVPGEGMIPDRRIEGDSVMIPTHDVGNSISYSLKYARDARWDVVGDAMEVLRDGFVKKDNDDGWHVLLAAGVDRNIVVYDSDATAGEFTKRLISLGKLAMRRNGGGNSSSVNRRVLTDLFVPPEAIEDMRNWGVDNIDDAHRFQFLEGMDSAGSVSLMGVNIHPIDELGENQEYQDFFTNELSGSLEASDTHLCVGLDLRRKSSTFVMPVRLQENGQEIGIWEDPTYHRGNRAGWYGRRERGFAVMDNSYVVLLSY